MADEAMEGLTANPAFPQDQLQVHTDLRLSLEIRSRKFGFVVLQGTLLLDYGICRYAAGVVGARTAVKKLSELFHLYTPSLVVVRRVRRAADEFSKPAKALIRQIRKEAEKHSIGFEIVSRKHIKRFFAEQNRKAKHEIFSLLALQFPQLNRILPRPRKPWDPEHYSTAIFDAIATAVAYEGRLADVISVQEV